MLSLCAVAMQSIINDFPNRLEELSEEDKINLKNIATYSFNQKMNQIFCEEILNQNKNLELLNYFSDISDIDSICASLSWKFPQIEKVNILLKIFPHLIKTINLSMLDIETLDKFDLLKIEELNLLTTIWALSVMTLKSMRKRSIIIKSL